MQNEPKTKPNLDAQYRTMLVLWFAILVSIVMYLVLAIAAFPLQAESNKMLTIAFSAASVFTAVVSFVPRRKFLARSMEEQEPRYVNTAHIAAAACCEAGALLGLLDKFVAGDPYYYLLIGVAFIAQILNFPRRAELEAATFKKL